MPPEHKSVRLCRIVGAHVLKCVLEYRRIGSNRLIDTDGIDKLAVLDTGEEGWSRLCTIDVDNQLLTIL